MSKEIAWVNENSRIKECHIRQIENAINSLNNTIEKINKYCPNAMVFVAGEGITTYNIMQDGDPEINRNNSEGRNSAVTVSMDLKKADCGGF